MTEVNSVQTCWHCGKEFTATEEDYHPVHDAGEQYICPSCVENWYTSCEYCGDLVNIEDDACYIEDREVYYCPSCARHHAWECSDCGHWYARDLIYVSNEDRHICRDCLYEGCYYECSNCGDIISEDGAHYSEWNDSYFCDACWQDNEDRVIYGYKDWTGEPSFYGFPADGLYFGAEVEIDKGGENDENAARLLDILGGESIAHCEHDGSLTDGFEIITSAFSLPYYMANIREKMADMMKEAVKMGYRAHDTNTCGLHIHVSRAPLEGHEETLFNILKRFRKEFIKLSRRKDMGKLEQYAAFPGEDTEWTYYSTGSRYHALNLRNFATLEFRFFQGTLKPESFTAAIQLIIGIARWALDHEPADVLEMSWDDFISEVVRDHLALTERHELIDYLMARDLYVPEVHEALNVTIGDVLYGPAPEIEVAVAD